MSANDLQPLDAEAQELLSSLHEVEGPSDIHRARLGQRLAATLAIPVATLPEIGAAGDSLASASSPGGAAAATTSASAAGTGGKLALLGVAKWIGVLAIGATAGVALQSQRSSSAPSTVPEVQKAEATGTTPAKSYPESPPAPVPAPIVAVEAITSEETPVDSALVDSATIEVFEPTLVPLPSVHKERAVRSLDPATRAAVQAEEREFLREARWLLREGRAAEAKEKLAVYRQVFPHGHLHEEGSALQIHAQILNGDMRAAKRAFARFRRARPRSIYLSSIEKLLSEKNSPPQTESANQNQ